MMPSELVVTPEDLTEAGYQTGNLKPCPFCGKPFPLTFTKFNPDTAIYGVRVVCSEWRCGADIHSNSNDAAEARARVVANWNRRALAAEGGAPTARARTVAPSELASWCTDQAQLERGLAEHPRGERTAEGQLALSVFHERRAERFEAIANLLQAGIAATTRPGDP